MTKIIPNMNDAELQEYINEISNQIDEDGYEHPDLADALMEQDIRAECAADPRVAQALGRIYS